MATKEAISIKINADHPLAKALTEAIKEKDAFRKAAEQGQALEYMRHMQSLNGTAYKIEL